MEAIKQKEKPVRTEEVDHLVSRMPTKFGVRGAMIVGVTTSLIVVLGFLVKYPDVQRGTAIINTSNPAVKLFSNHQGKIILLKKNQSIVQEGDIIGYLDNSADVDDVAMIDSFLSGVDIKNRDTIFMLYKLLPSKVRLGSCNSSYYTFVSTVQQYVNYYNDDLYGAQITALGKLVDEQHEVLGAVKNKSSLLDSNLKIMRKFSERDSILLEKKVISPAEYERNQLNYLNSLGTVENARSEKGTVRLELQKTISTLQEVQIKAQQTEKEIQITLTSAYHELVSNLHLLEDTYFFKSPIQGTVQYLNFWNNNYFVKSGDPVFSIIPSNSEIHAQVIIPNAGAGKVKPGQEVIIKLDDYPYNEYGSINGVVDGISLVTNTENTQEGQMENYLITVALPNQLSTNYGADLLFRYELKGTAEIITMDRKLIHRVFDNINYMLKR
jgi:hypothetical protein